TREAWVFSGYASAITHKPVAIPGANQVAVYYVRPDANYTGWGLHTWGPHVKNPTQWGGPLAAVGIDPDLGEGWLVDTITTVNSGSPCPLGDVCIIVHNGDTKDTDADMGWALATLGNIVFVTSGSASLTAMPKKSGDVSITGAAAHLVEPLLVAWDVTDAAATTFELRYSSTASIAASGTNVTGGQTIALTPSASELPPAVQAKAPYLNTGGTWWRAFTIAAADASKVQDALKGQLVAVARKSDGSVLAATQVQTAWAIDALWPYSGPLGVAFDTPNTPTIRLWAPTAQAVKVHVADPSKAEIAAVDMSEDASGVWSATGPSTWYAKYYRFEVKVFHPASGQIETTTVTDPYAVNLDTNGLWGQLIDLGDPATKPAGWDALTKPALAAAEDIVVYEGHIRDFSALDATVTAANRGKYLAFTETGSNGMLHLKALADAGLTHFHLLPAFDFATVNEDPAQRVDIGQPFSELCSKNSAVPSALCTQFGTTPILTAIQSYPGTSDQQQAIAGYMAGLDSFNWGYDPFHYGAPEGSYASSAEGALKILEFRQMVKALAGINLRVVMDVVYNHTNAAGLGDKSVLDKIVPGYYHRLNPTTGFVLTSSCCANTASEHLMMEKLMIDTLVRWARDYRVDAFRFDLMGLHLKDNMLHIRDALAAVNPTIYLYGEGWDMGEMVRGGRGVAANQINMAGTGIGTFNDRLRDGARGGGPFDGAADLRKNQGFSSGLYTDPNELSTADAASKSKLANALDLIKIGMAGGLTNFPMVLASGATSVAGAVGYNGVSAGYTSDPQETINYVSSHDNQILWDIVQYKMPTGRSMDARLRAVAQAIDVILLGQGIPFIPMGDDLIRSKSMERDSYDSGDWFNRVDWTGTSNGWKSGLPNSGKDSANWPVITPIFADASIAPAAADIAKMSAHVQAMLKLRKASPLFRLPTAAEVINRVDFINAGPSQVPGLIVMTISDTCAALTPVDGSRTGLVVIVNAGTTAQDVAIPGTSASSSFTIPAALASGNDPLLAGHADWNVTASGKFHVDAHTTAVFETNDAAGLPCNTKPHP
ncbi:MAG TPA: pullulanase-type alpha-1,6-glucosidase, partial [Myxococcaceae bacterium]|nr:pullulanase-type alpha-1,6-glucosidase [Myxococcaceae bacterium]